MVLDGGDCLDVRAQAAWWARALDWKPAYESDDECVIIPSWVDEAARRDTPWERIGPGLVFVRVSEPKAVKNRLHLCLRPDGFREGEVERLIGLGASMVDDRREPNGLGWAVLADPEGNEFCVLRGIVDRQAEAQASVPD